MVEEKKQNDLLGDAWRKVGSYEECEIYKVQKYLEDCNPDNIDKLPLISRRAFELENYEEAKETFLDLYKNDLLALKNTSSTAKSL